MLLPGPCGATLECQAFGAGVDGQPLPYCQGRVWGQKSDFYVGQELQGLILSSV